MSENDDLLDPKEIDALFKSADQPSATAADPETTAASSTEELLDKAQADLAAAVQPDLDSEIRDKGIPAELGDVTPFELDSFDRVDPSELESSALETLRDVDLEVRIELGRTELLIEEVLKLKQGSVVPLDKLAGDPVDILVNDRLIARGEVLVLNDNFCVRVSEILAPEN